MSQLNIGKLELGNFRSALKCQFEFTHQLNLLVGVNGSGKSTVLDALSICLSWLVKRIERGKGRGLFIPDSSLSNDQSESFLNISLNEGEKKYQWLLSKTAKGSSSHLESQLDGVSQLAESIKKTHEEDTSWPVIGYYPVNRAVENTKPEIHGRDSLYSLDVFENALNGRANYQSFFKWFRIQDDILNEKFSSRADWIKQNRRWIKQRVSRLIDSLKKYIFEDDKHLDREEFKSFIVRFQKDEMIYEEPRFLFRELTHLLELVGMRSRENFNYKVFHELEYMFQKMSSYSRHFGDDFIEEGGRFERMLEKIIRSYDRIGCETSPGDKAVLFLGEVIIFAVSLSLWWISNKGKQDLERELRIFRNPEKFDGKNHQPLKYQGLFELLRIIIKREFELKDNAKRNEGRELQIVSRAIERFIPGLNHLRVKRLPRPHMLINKEKKTFNLDQLSDGEKNLIALVGDIARRLAIGNPRKDNPLNGSGIILIDEIDLHLHPSWQRLVIPKLLEVFPNCQFFISTHSPQVISHVKPENVFLLEQDKTGMRYRKVDETYGMSIDRVVEIIMDDESRPAPTQENLDRIFEFIERDQFNEARELASELKSDMKTDPDLMRAEMLIRRGKQKK